MKDSLKVDKKNFTKIQVGYIINLDWLDDVMSRPDRDNVKDEEEQKELDKALFSKTVLAVILLVNDNIDKVLVAQNNLQKINWGHYNQCYLSTSDPIYVQDKLKVPKLIEAHLEMIEDYPDLCMQIPAWKIKTFGLMA